MYLNEHRSKSYLVKVECGGFRFYVGPSRMVTSERDAREFTTPGEAHAHMHTGGRREGGYSVVPATHWRPAGARR